jgi:hypothetical protein
MGETLRYVQHQLDVLNAVRLNGPFDEASERHYRALCRRESELLAEAQAIGDRGRPLGPGHAQGTTNGAVLDLTTWGLWSRAAGAEDPGPGAPGRATM